MNTHKILSEAGYSLRPDYPEIAQYAAKLDISTKDELLQAVWDVYGNPERMLKMQARPAPISIWGDVGTDIEYGALTQMQTVASIPPSLRGAMMPDAHVGYGMPIGGVIAMDNAVSPGFVGFDIACRVMVTILDILPDDFLADREWFASIMREESAFGKDASFYGSKQRSHYVMDDPLWRELVPLRNLKNVAQRQLGSSGGGNHFFDAVIGTVLAETSWLPLPTGDNFVAIMTHSGSRGTGHKLATYYTRLAKQYTATIARGIPSGYEWLDINTEWGQEYLSVMRLMGDYASANHHLIHEHFMKSAGVMPIAQYENHHNFAWVDHDGIVVHRKGATPAGYGIPGIIPGTSGTPSYIVFGLGNEESIESSSHGAGRPFSRTEAKRRHDENFVNEWMQYNDIMTFGLSPDETLLAYKDIDRVMELQSDLVVPVAKMYPKIVIMGGTSDDGD